MKTKRKHLTPELARNWADMAHIFFIDALSKSAPLTLDKVSFHGGTNLHISWGSPRYSEDLDFIVARDFGSKITDLMPKIEKRMRVLAAAVDPDLKISITDKTKDPEGLLNFKVVMTSSNVLGKVMAKAEFWQVEDDYLNEYDAKFVQPQNSKKMVSRLSQPIPAATLTAAFSDKVVAIGYRPHLKWRDIFDLWWINNQGQINPADHIDDIVHHATAYTGPDSNSLAEGLRIFLERDPEDVLKAADPDLKRWLPKQLWDTLYPDGVMDMIENARSIAEKVIEGLPLDVEVGGGDNDEDLRP